MPTTVRPWVRGSQSNVHPLSGGAHPTIWKLEGALRTEGYQAWPVPQWGQPTDVVTSALKLYPHWHRYRA